MCFVSPATKETERLDRILANLIEEFELEETAQYDMLQSLLKQFIVYSVRVKKEYDVVKANIENIINRYPVIEVREHFHEDYERNKGKKEEEKEAASFF